MHDLAAAIQQVRQDDGDELIEVSSWQDCPVPQTEWTVLKRIPHKTVSNLSGDGGIGKSLLAQQLEAAMSLGKDWLGTMPEPGASIHLSAEDDTDELHRRFAKIAEHHGVQLADLTGLYVKSLAGADAVRAEADRFGIVRPTNRFDWLRRQIEHVRPRLVTLDTAADVFAGSEIDRSQVRQFIGLLRGLAVEYDTAVLLLSHPSLTG